MSSAKSSASSKCPHTTNTGQPSRLSIAADTTLTLDPHIPDAATTPCVRRFSASSAKARAHYQPLNRDKRGLTHIPPIV